MKKILLLILSIFLSSYAMSNDHPAVMKKVYINQSIAHPALDETARGILDGLEKEGFKKGVNLIICIEIAQANAALAMQIAAKFASQNPDITVGIGTICAQSLAKYAKENKVKLVFSSITDPLGANLIKSLKKPGNNISGVSNFIDLEPQLKLFLQLQPRLRRLGIIYNPGEMNSINIVKRLEALSDKFNLTLIKQTVNKTSDVPQAAVKLVGSVDAIFIGDDNTALSAIQSVISIAHKVKIPVFADPSSVELGALAALGPNQYQVGLKTGKMIARCLKGEDISTIPVEFLDHTDIYINEKIAKELEIPIPNRIKNCATRIF